VEKLVVEGGRPLNGVVQISGSKNAALPILAATILATGKCVIKNVPMLKDVDTLGEILRELGVGFERRSEDGAIETEVVDESKSFASYELVSTMRASFNVLGPLLARRGYAKVSLPGGCVLGTRPVGLHLKGLRALGADLQVEHGYVIARIKHGKRLRGAHIYLGGPFGPTVTGTANVLCAAVLADGKTVIEGAACEPEIQDLCGFLNAMGATIYGAGTPRLEITGVPELKGASYQVIPDRMEAGTFAIGAAMTGGTVRLRDARIEHMTAAIDRFAEIGVKLEQSGDELIARRDPDFGGDFRPADVVTLPYPGYPTDLQAQLVAMLTLANGISVVTEKIYPARFMHIAELNRMGANIRKEGPSAIISGVKRLSGADVMASDLRASAALVLAGLVAKGETNVHRVYHIDRGYEKIEHKLERLGARIRRVKDEG
jgi:UDP-N-acetylglucosamine 1-carboxyvinyltransferase